MQGSGTELVCRVAALQLEADTGASDGYLLASLHAFHTTLCEMFVKMMHRTNMVDAGTVSKISANAILLRHIICCLSTESIRMRGEQVAKVGFI